MRPPDLRGHHAHHQRKPAQGGPVGRLRLKAEGTAKSVSDEDAALNVLRPPGQSPLCATDDSVGHRGKRSYWESLRHWSGLMCPRIPSATTRVAAEEQDQVQDDSNQRSRRRFAKRKAVNHLGHSPPVGNVETPWFQPLVRQARPCQDHKNCQH